MPDDLTPSSKPLAITMLVEYGEEERRRIAREIHDDISQRLALLADELNTLRDDLTLSGEKNLSRMNSLIQQARSLAEDLRDISHALHPAVLDDLGLEVALRALVRHFGERSGLAVRFVAANVPRHVPVEAAGALYRIAQEALRNISKHAGDTPVMVTLEVRGQQLELIIRDQGGGFDLKKTTGLGLVSMRERALLNNGEFQLKSEPDQGTSVEVRLPLSGLPAADTPH